MASAVITGRNEPHWDKQNAYKRKYTTNPTAHSQLHTRFNPNPNPNYNLQNFSTMSHLQQVNEPLPRAAPSPAIMATSKVPFNWKPNAVDGTDLFHREYVVFNLASYSRSELKDLKKMLSSELDRVQGLLDRIETQDFVPRTSFHAREVIQPPMAPWPQSALAPNASRQHREPVLIGKKSKKHTGQKRPRTIDLGKDLVVEGDKFFVNMMKTCRQILGKIMKKKYGRVFNAPVDVKGLNLYDYHDFIKHPMDLGTVKSRLDKNVYRTPQDFAADVRLTFTNAMTYNPKGQHVHNLAEEYLGIFEEMFKPAYEKYEAEHHKVATIMQQVHQQMNLSQPAPNTKLPPLPVAKKSGSARSHSTLLNQHQSHIHSFSEPVAPLFATPASKSPPQPVVEMPRSARTSKLKVKDPNKRLMTEGERDKLGNELQNLPPENMEHVLQLVKRKFPNLTEEGNEVELDLEIIDNETLWELYRYVISDKESMSKIERSGVTENAAAVLLNKSPEKAPTPEHAKPEINEVDVVEEDVDIGEEIPGENFPPVHIDKDPSSSSGSSSGSDSSSGDSGSSSESDSDEDSVQSPYVEAAKEAPAT
ncbi:transcription factor GTE7 isoform X2 [Solanum lycopersicum]|uniref:Uncharacterized protein n=1 Tax=Solanum lycopersicum TaxID=4081 RepID=A0A3Q7FCV7_SOLLC|nr:transcription factor GTE7 isoform X2 [Solanum lycopersicum]